MFLVDGAKYLDLPGLIALGDSSPLWVKGEGKAPGEVAEWLMR